MTTESPVSINSTIDEWNKLNNEIKYKILKKNVNKTDEGISSYSTCFYCNEDCERCKQDFNFQTSGNKCNGCNTLSRLFRDGIIKYSTPIKIEYGTLKDRHLIIKKFQNDNSRNINTCMFEESKVDDKLKNLIPRLGCGISYNFNELKWLLNQYDDISYIALISIIINSELAKTYIKYISSTFMWSYVCDNNVVTIDYYPSYGQNLYSVDFYKEENLVENVIIQLILYLYQMIDFDYFHGENTLEYLSLDSKKLSIKITTDDESKTYKPTVNLKINNSKNTTFSIENYMEERVCFLNKKDILSINTDDLSNKFTIKPIIEKNNKHSKCIPEDNFNCYTNEYTSHRSLVYKINKNLVYLMISTGINVYESLNLYLFMISLLCKQDFYDVFMKNNKLINILKSLFLDKEYDIFIEEIKKYHKTKVTFDDLIDIGSKVFFRCNGLITAYNLTVETLI